MRPLAIIPKSLNEEYRIDRQQFRNGFVVGLRVFRTNEKGQMRAGDEGVAIRMDHLPDIIRGLKAALLGAGNG